MPLPKRADAFDPAVRPLAPVPERRAKEPPERVAAEPDGERREQHVAEGVLLDGAERALLVRDLAAVPDGEVEGEQPDDPVDERARDEAGTRQDRVERRADEPLAGRAGARHESA